MNRIAFNVGIFIVFITLCVYLTTIEAQIEANHNSRSQSDSIEVKWISLDRATQYNCQTNQCDSSPLITADGNEIDLQKLDNGQLRWCALSRDLLSRWGGPFNYKDTIRVRSQQNSSVNGLWVIHDTMNRRYKKSIDFLFSINDSTRHIGVLTDVEITNK